MKISERSQRVSNWIWTPEGFNPDAKLSIPGAGGLQPSDLSGQFALHQMVSGDEHLLVRDRLGVRLFERVLKIIHG